MSSEKPVVVVIHGAWQRQQQYQLLGQSLVDRGFEVLRPESATSGQETVEIQGKTYLDDVAVIHKTMEPSLAAGREIVLVCHSYGGIPTSAAAEGYQIHERQEKGLTGGIKHIVYLAAAALPSKGSSLITTVGGSYADWMDKQVCSSSANAWHFMLNDRSRATWYRSKPVPAMHSLTTQLQQRQIVWWPDASTRVPQASKHLLHL